MGSGSQEVPLCPAPHSGTINWQCEEALYFSALHLSLSVLLACLAACMLVESIPGWLEIGVLGTHRIQDKELFKGQAGSGVLPSVLINFQTLYTFRGSQLPLCQGPKYKSAFCLRSQFDYM